MSWQNEVFPLLARNTAVNAKGCVTATGCHASGSGGFTITVGNAAATYDEVLEAGENRVNVANPAASLLLTKATNTVGHSGGARWAVGDADYNKTLLWIQQGANEN